jgi:UDP-N-acetylglucosamine acyltransferase
VEVSLFTFHLENPDVYDMARLVDFQGEIHFSLFTAFMIHPTAVIHPDAQIAENVTVHPFVVIEADVAIGEGTELGAGTVLLSGSRLGKNCRLSPHVVVGGTPMDTKFKGERSFAVIEDNVELREFVTVHRATGEGAETRVGESSLIMCNTHISHNVKIGRECTLTTTVQLGGHCQLGDYVVIGSGSMMHQYCRIGDYAMFGAGSGTNQDILPFSMARGNVAQHFRLNKVGLERRGITGERYKILEKAIRAFRRRDWTLLEELATQSEDVKTMLEFKHSSKRGLCSFIS